MGKVLLSICTILLIVPFNYAQTDESSSLDIEERIEKLDSLSQLQKQNIAGVNPNSQNIVEDAAGESDPADENDKQTIQEEEAEDDQMQQSTEIPAEDTNEQIEATETMQQMDDKEVILFLLKANNNLNWKMKEIATFVNERIVTLNLNNQNVGKEGITRLVLEIGNLTELKKLTINDNDLIALPAALFTLPKLEVLEIRNNSLMSLPSGISNLKKLQILDLRNNQLPELPAEIGLLKSLWKLQLWGNNFVELPPEIANLSKLKELYLKGNRLRNIPGSFTRLKLSYLDVLDNKLCNITGPVDAWLRKYEKKYQSLQKCLNQKRFQ